MTSSVAPRTSWAVFFDTPAFAAIASTSACLVTLDGFSSAIISGSAARAVAGGRRAAARGAAARNASAGDASESSSKSSDRAKPEAIRLSCGGCD